MSDYPSAKPAFALLPPQALTEFKQIYKRKYAIELSNESASQKATALLNIFQVFQKRKEVKKYAQNYKGRKISYGAV